MIENYSAILKLIIIFGSLLAVIIFNVIYVLINMKKIHKQQTKEV